MRISIKLPNGLVEAKDFNQSVVSIGRSTKNDFAVGDESLSRQHCQIEYIKGEFFITDLGSANGVYLDGTRIPSNTKTPFTTFLQLHIASLECQVTDLEDAPPIEYQPRPLEDQKTVNELTKTVSLSKRVFPKKEAVKKDNSLFIKIAAFLIIAAGVYYQFSGEKNVESETITSDQLIEKNVPVPLRDVKDEFMSLEAYESIEADKTCVDQEDICKQLKLSTDRGEGVVRQEDEYFIYMIPELHTQIPILRDALKDKPDYLDIVGLYTALVSEVFELYQQKKIGQVHIIFKTRDLKTNKVHRFHTKNYAKNERIRLVTEIATVLETGNSVQFWKYAAPLIQTREF